jgi:hypothetical protein
MNQGSRRESENLPHRFFIRNAYLFEMGRQNILPGGSASAKLSHKGECVSLEPRWN